MLRWGPWVIYAFTAVLGRPAFAQTNPSVAFFYGKPVPVGQLGRFDWVVVEPDHLDARGLDELQRAGVQVFAYLSLGEAAPEAIDPGWILGRNAPWGSVIVDPRAAEWRSRILARVDALAARGFHGLFLDTLDSYAMVLRAEARRAAAVAMASLIRDISDHHRDVKLLFNRGFELLDDVGGRASAVAAESLLYGWDAAAKRYVDVPAADRAWLTDKLHHVEQHFGIPVIVIDYLPESRREDARATARRIQAMGFVPWIATPALDTLGVGTIQSHAARILLLYDGAEPHSPITDLIAERLQALGCAVDYLDVRRGLPREPNGHRAGIVSWFSDDDLPEVLGYGRWLARQIDAGSRVVMFGRPGFPVPRPTLAKLALREDAASSARAARGPARRPDRRRAAPAQPRARALARRGPLAPRSEARLEAPWMALAPLLAGVRYGSCFGVACAVAQVAMVSAAAHWYGALDAPTGQPILGWLLAGLIPGQFCDAWRRRLHQLAARACDATLVLASISEGLPLVVLEAFASGLPVLTTDVGACRELVEGRTPDDCEQGAAGAVVPFADPDAVAHAALALLGDPARWRAAQQAAIRRVETHCTEARVFDACRRIYQEAHTWRA